MHDREAVNYTADGTVEERGHRLPFVDAPLHRKSSSSPLSAWELFNSSSLAAASASGLDLGRRIRQNWVFWCIPALLVIGLGAFLFALCLWGGRGPLAQQQRTSRLRQRPEELGSDALLASRGSGARKQRGGASSLSDASAKSWASQSEGQWEPSQPARPVSGSLEAGGAVAPSVAFPRLRRGWVPQKECSLAVFPEALANSTEFANFTVKSLEDGRSPMQATVLYGHRRLTMFAEPDLRTPCVTIAPPPEGVAGILEVREADGSHFAMLDAEANGTYFLDRGGSSVMTIDSSTRTSMSLRIACGGAYMGKVTCRGWERVEGELVEVRLQPGVDAALAVGAVLAVLLLGEDEAEGDAAGLGVTGKASLSSRTSTIPGGGDFSFALKKFQK